MPSKGKLILVCGVAGSGKSTLAQSLAKGRGSFFLEADDFHSPATKRKMQQGQPLNHGDRMLWINRLVEALNQRLKDGGEVVLACSALKREYRKRLSAVACQTKVLFLAISEEAVRHRIKAREKHFFPLALIRDQFETLEEPEKSTHINAWMEKGEILTAANRLLNSEDYGASS